MLTDTDSGWLRQIPEWALGRPVQCRRLVSRTGKRGDAFTLHPQGPLPPPFCFLPFLPAFLQPHDRLPSGFFAASTDVTIITRLSSEDGRRAVRIPGWAPLPLSK